MKKIYRTKMIKLGLCVDCCTNYAVSGKRCCKECQAKHRVWSRLTNEKYRQIYRDNRQCTRCSAPLEEGEKQMCFNCRHNATGSMKGVNFAENNF